MTTFADRVQDTTTTTGTGDITLAGAPPTGKQSFNSAFGTQVRFPYFIAGGAEWAMHATGRYPDWWDGAVFNKPPILWAGSVTGEATRDNPQRILVGPPAIEESWGTGFLPKACIKDWDRALGIANLLDNVQVQWGGGGDVQAGTSVISFKAYEKGREKWQGPTVDGVWFDEEPPQDIYSEGLTRTNNGQRGQFTQITFTPLLGMSDVVHLFLDECGMGE